MAPAKVRLAMAAMGKPEIKISDLCEELVLRDKLFIGM